MKVDSIQVNPDNPRVISDENLEKLRNSLQDFSKMMNLRPIVIDDDNVVLGGNQRLAAIIQLGMKEIPDEWVARASDFTEEEKQKFIILDNLPLGEWDYGRLGGWDPIFLDAWDIAIPDRQTDFSDRNIEVDLDELPEKIALELFFTIEEHAFINKTLREINEDLSTALLKALNYA